MVQFVVNKALLIAYHYPPVHVSSGVQRTLAFSHYLRDHNWESVVLSANTRAYEKISEEQLKDIPKEMEVKRAFALNSAKHLAINGRYSDYLALPDRWVSWWLGGIFSGLKLIWKYKPKVIWSTYPIASAHLIGYTLHRLTGIPWIADFRDSMTDDVFPEPGKRRSVYSWIERKVIKYCCKAVFTTPGAVKIYRERYPEIPEDRWVMISNGYNEEIFSEVEQDLWCSEENSVGPLVLVHSGVVYPSERDPRPFFKALSELKQSHKVNSSTVKIIFRAGGHDEIFEPVIKELAIEDIVELAPPVSYREALKEILNANGLIILQASNCNHQVPAKVYEYFRSRKPVFSLTDIKGDTAATLLEAGLEDIAPLDDSEVIKKQLLAFLESLSSGNAKVANEESIIKYSREYGAKQLAEIFDQVKT